MPRWRSALLSGVLALGSAMVVACATRRGAPPAAPLAPAPLPAKQPPASVDLAILDRHVDPCADFYRYACGGWLDATVIPPDRPAWSRSFSEIDERNLAALRAILDAYAAGAPANDTEARKLGNFYSTCMDEEQAALASPRTLAEHMRPLHVLAGWASSVSSFTRPVLARLLAELHLADVGALFELSSQQDFGNAREVVAGLDQGGLGLPDREYYLATDAKAVEIRDAYKAHVARMFELDGTASGEAHARADAVLAVETALARASMPRTEHRDPSLIHHPLDRAGLAELAPDFDWDAYLALLGHPEMRAFNVLTPAFFTALDRLLVETPPPRLESYLAWRLLDEAAPALGPAFVDEWFAFRARNLTGEATLPPRWKRCLRAVEAGMGQALGRRFVAATFPPGAEERARSLVTAVEGALRADLAALGWIDAPTRAEAERKLERVYNQIGYPSRWRDYSALVIGRQSDLQNRFNAAAVEMERDLGKIGRPVDRSDWEMPPQMVNAYYDPSKNEMVFPAGILEPPFFDGRAPAALNDGGIGMVMGHELTHGFDDQGRKFDADGNLRDWWTPSVARGFEERVACVVSQYDAYPVAGTHVSGRLTVGEDIADMGGLRLAHEVFSSTAAAQQTGAFTDEQRFFLAFAQAWCTKRRAPYARTLVGVDPHAPPEFRVNGAVSDLEAFQRAFACKTGAPMAPARRCRVW